MLLAALEPRKELLSPTLFLRLCLFTFALPLLLTTRADKTEAKLDFLVATVNQ